LGTLRNKRCTEHVEDLNTGTLERRCSGKPEHVDSKDFKLQVEHGSFRKKKRRGALANQSTFEGRMTMMMQ
jgi:hypothetical protein